MSSEARVVLVTGASAGFGRAIAEHLTGHGYKVYGASRQPQPGGPFPMIAMDVDNDASVSAGVAEVIAREGRLDAVIGNAGMGIAGALEDTTCEEGLAQFQTNFFGNHRLVRAALPHLRRQDLAHIIIVGSLAGLVGIPFQGMYAASKFALEGYVEALRLELRGGPVRVTVLEPGDFATGFTSSRQKVAASGEGSLYKAAFDRAMAIIDADERDGADPAAIGPVVREVLEDPKPPVRRAVVGPKQEGVETAKRDLSPDDLEDMIADHFLP
ncbi:MAG: SDR family oxidoreductase [Phenylobacterium sp.]|uniref:SDR family oxidoreductase n=1 Tax=Phenylobacterium sp. TaxID=1871053 RepID=UPI001214289F|nr:SDR family oxidoreductase [Phenylobacterium sp.]TAJ71839.1 MAG: SDR family oxidoreductase [Phenylobacterium sp.]